MKFILIVALLISSSALFANANLIKKLSPADKKVTDQILIEKGGLIQLEQFLKSKNKDPEKRFMLSYLCQKKDKKNNVECKIISVEND
jgi:hypothetical protein